MNDKIRMYYCANPIACYNMDKAIGRIRIVNKISEDAIYYFSSYFNLHSKLDNKYDFLLY